MEVKIEKIRQESKMSSLSTTATTGIKSCWTRGSGRSRRGQSRPKGMVCSFIYKRDRKDYEKGSKIKRNRREKLIEIKNTADSEYDSGSAIFYVRGKLKFIPFACGNWWISSQG